MVRLVVDLKASKDFFRRKRRPELLRFEELGADLKVLEQLKGELETA